MLSPEAEAACKRLNGEFLAAMTRVCGMDCVADRANTAVDFLPLVVTTMTMLGRFVDAWSGGVPHVPVDDLRRSAAADPALAEALGLDTGPGPKRRRRCETTSFVNQVTFRPRDGGKAAKLFHNGSLHVTGCSSTVDFLEMAHAIGLYVHTAVGVGLRLADVTPSMINASTAAVRGRGRTPVRFPPVALCHAALARGFRPDFDPERHPGVKLVARDAGGARVATACVFQTGNVSIIGARSPAAMADVFGMVGDMLRACVDVSSSADGGVVMCRTTSTKPFRLCNGYPLGSFMACLT